MLNAAIPATARVALELVRASGATQVKRDTPQAQRESLDGYQLAHPGLHCVRIEEKRALSGALNFKNRPDLQELVRLLKTGQVVEVRMRDLDRLTRHSDPRETWFIFGAIADAKAVIVETSTGEVIDPSTDAGKDTLHFRSRYAAREREMIKRRTAPARRAKAAAGEIQARPPYARTWDKATKTWGVKQAELEVYRRLFTDYLAGKSCAKIADALNAEGVPPPGSRWKRRSEPWMWKDRPMHWRKEAGWTSGSVYSLLIHRSAVGEITSCGEKIACPSVVDLATFRKVQERLKVKNWLAGKPPADDLQALLRGLAICSECGSTTWVTRGGSKGRYSVYYVCGRYQSAKEKVCRTRHRVDEIDADLKARILSWLDGRDIFRRATEHAHATDVKQSDPAAELKAAEKELRDLDRREENLARLLSKGLTSKTQEKLLGEIARERSDALARKQRASMTAEERGAEVKERRAVETEVRRMRRAIENADFNGWRRLTELVVRQVLREPIAIRPDGSLQVGRKP